ARRSSTRRDSSTIDDRGLTPSPLASRLSLAASTQRLSNPSSQIMGDRHDADTDEQMLPDDLPWRDALRTGQCDTQHGQEEQAPGDADDDRHLKGKQEDRNSE